MSSDSGGEFYACNNCVATSFSHRNERPASPVRVIVVVSLLPDDVVEPVHGFLLHIWQGVVKSMSCHLSAISSPRLMPVARARKKKASM